MPSSWRATACQRSSLKPGHTLAIAVWGNQGPTMVHWAEAPQTVPVTLRLGDVMPLLTSATGRCFAAFMGQDGPDAQRIGPMVREELARVKKMPRSDVPLVDVPQTLQEVQAVMDETRAQGLGRVVHSLLPGVGGSSVRRSSMPRAGWRWVWWCWGRWRRWTRAGNGAPAQALRRSAQQLSTDLGYRVQP